MAYYESRLRIDYKDFDDIRKKLEICEKLHITNLIIEPTNTLKLNQEIRNKIADLTSIDLNYRINLRPKSIKHLKNVLNVVGSGKDLVSLESSDKKIQIQGAKDSRIDLMTFSDINLMKTMTPGLISLTKQNNSFIEISIASIMEKRKSLQSKNFREIFRAIDLVLRLKGNLIISGNFRNICHFRNPRALISICHTLLGLSLNEAKKCFKLNVERAINRAFTRHNKHHIENGVKIIREGENYG